MSEDDKDKQIQQLETTVALSVKFMGRAKAKLREALQMANDDWEFDPSIKALIQEALDALS